MEENHDPTILIKLRNFYIDKYALRAIGRLLFKPVEAEEYDGKIPSYKVIVDFLSDATEDLLNKLAENEKNLNVDYAVEVEKTKKHRQAQKKLQEIKELMGLTEKIFGKVRESLSDSESKTS